MFLYFIHAFLWLQITIQGGLSDDTYRAGIYFRLYLGVYDPFNLHTQLKHIWFFVLFSFALHSTLKIVLILVGQLHYCISTAISTTDSRSYLFLVVQRWSVWATAPGFQDGCLPESDDSVGGGLRGDSVPSANCRQSTIFCEGGVSFLGAVCWPS